MSKTVAIILTAVLAALGGAAIAVAIMYALFAARVTTIEPVALNTPAAPSNIPPVVSEPSNQPAVVATDDRTLLEPSSEGGYYPGPGEAPCTSFVQDEPTATATYSSTKYGLEVEVPYSPTWGNAQYRINPFDEWSLPDDTVLARLSMGPLVSGFEGCGWVRIGGITFIPPRSVDAAMAAVEAEDPDGVFPLKTLEERTINGLTVIASEREGTFCSGGENYEIIGEKANYLLSDCFLPPGFPTSQEFIATFSLI